MNIHEKTAEQTKLAAFHIWQHTGCEDTLSLWYLAEDIAGYLEHHGLLGETALAQKASLPADSAEYIDFIRQIAYRLYIYIGINDETYNWHITERLLSNAEWCHAVLMIAAALHALRDMPAHMSGYQPYSPAIRELYR